MSKTAFSRNGAIWSHTCVRISVQDRAVPYLLAYVDLDDGPRILAHLDEPSRALKVGDRVRLTRVTESGDAVVVLETRSPLSAIP
jgi:uncharacterized OB-fold protein